LLQEWKRNFLAGTESHRYILTCGGYQEKGGNSGGLQEKRKEHFKHLHAAHLFSIAHMQE
jgi:hypothetical protein